MRISQSLTHTLCALGLFIGVAALGMAGLYLIIHVGALSSQSHSSAYRDITWEDLLEQRRPPSTSMMPGGQPTSLGSDPWAKLSDDVESSIRKSTAKPSGNTARTHLKLDGADVRLAGYLIPLQDSPDHAVTEFFLVPYVGACIHVPPPPPDQIIYVKFPLGIRIDNIYQAFRVEGTLHTQALNTGLANTSYMMVADEVSFYDPQTAQ